MATITYIDLPNAATPGISQAVSIEGGRLLVLSGHVPMDATGKPVGDDVATQLAQVFDNMAKTLAAAGAGFADVVRLTYYICDYSPAMLPQIRAVRDRYIDMAKPPASALIGVSALFLPGVMIEVDALAVLPD